MDIFNKKHMALMEIHLEKANELIQELRKQGQRKTAQIKSLEAKLEELKCTHH